jgi:hypothetical protein
VMVVRAEVERFRARQLPHRVVAVGVPRRIRLRKFCQMLPGLFPPRMRHSFVDRQYSPSTSMYHSEWEIILGELIHMGFLVKHEPVSEGENE